MQSNRALAGGGGLGRANTTSSTASSLSSRPTPQPSRSISSGSSFKKPPPPPPGSFKAAGPPPPYTVGNGTSTSSVVGKKPPPPPPLKPKPKVESPKEIVVAIYDFEAQADGDLSFKAGDRIEIVEKSASAEDWWTGKLNGVQGVFPGGCLPLLEFRCPTESSPAGNYVQDT